MVGPKKILSEKKNLGSKEIWVWKKIVGLKRIWEQRKFEFEVFFGSNKMSGLKTLGSNKILCLEKVLSKNILVKSEIAP